MKMTLNNGVIKLLLHKSINASLNDAPFNYKIEKYCSSQGNIYSESLGETAYKNNPQFKRFIEENNLNFKPYVAFGKIEIEERNQVITQLIKLIWNNKMFIS